MTLPKQFTKENQENILIYHYTEELVNDFTQYIDKNRNDPELNNTELPFLLRIRCTKQTTQKDLVKLFKVSDGYTAKLLKKFEDKEYITRKENPENRRQKIVTLTEKGKEKTNQILTQIKTWENQHTQNLTPEETKQLKKLLYKYLEK